MLSITIETQGGREISALLAAFPREMAKAARRAVVRGTRAAGTLAGRVVSRDMGLRVGDVRKRMDIRDPRGSSLEGEVRGSLKRVPRIEFNAKGPEPSKGKGRVTWRGSRGGVPGAFIATMGSGHRGVFKREGRARLPIRELKGPSVGHVMAEHEREIVARGLEQFEKELDHQVDRLLGSFGGSISTSVPSFGGRLAA